MKKIPILWYASACRLPNKLQTYFVDIILPIVSNEIDD